MTPVRKWRRFLAVGCSHGNRICSKWRKTVLDFKRRWRPETTVHLGDFVDTAAWRAGAHGTPDEAESLPADFSEGLQFLRELAPQVVHLGNHDHRPYKHLSDTNAIVAHAASWCVHQIEETAKELKAQLVPYHIKDGWRRPFGSDILTGHGYVHNENAVRDSAETAGGRVMIAHVHTRVEVAGRNLAGGSSYCVGYGADFDKMGYAHQRRASLRWQQSFAFGEYSDNETIVWLAQQATSGEWRLPV